MQRLVVKNFGPLKDIDIELKPINLIIGENGSGKSVLGKLIAILKKSSNWPVSMSQSLQISPYLFRNLSIMQLFMGINQTLTKK